MRADRTHRTYRSPTRALSKPRHTPGPNCGSLVREGIFEGRRAASPGGERVDIRELGERAHRLGGAEQVAVLDEESGLAGDRAGLASARRARTGPRAGLRAPLGQHRSPAKKPRSPRRAGSSGQSRRAALAAITARATIRRRRPYCISRSKPRRVIPAKAGIQPWDTTKRRHMPGSRRERPKAASLIASWHPGCWRTRA